MEIRRVRPHEWEPLRDVRLRAVADAPDAFGTTHAEALARSEQWWRDWADVSATCDEQAMYLAWSGDEVVGIAGVYSGPQGWQVISMWVEPAQRGAGIGRDLLDAVVQFAWAQGAAGVTLSVTNGNGAARRLYERYGFADTGASEPLRSNAALTIRDLRLER